MTERDPPGVGASRVEIPAASAGMTVEEPGMTEVWGRE